MEDFAAGGLRMILGDGSLQSFPTAIAVGIPKGFRSSSSLQKRKAGRNGPNIFAPAPTLNATLLNPVPTPILSPDHNYSAPTPNPPALVRASIPARIPHSYNPTPAPA